MSLGNPKEDPGNSMVKIFKDLLKSEGTLEEECLRLFLLRLFKEILQKSSYDKNVGKIVINPERIFIGTSQRSHWGNL